MEDSRPAAPAGRILLIDDDKVFGLWATKVLARDFNIKHVLDPVTGLREIESEPWDLVITDVEMPRMSGLEFMERARRLVPGLPIVVVTAHPTVDRALTALRQPATDFIHKPITGPDFAARVAALVAANLQSRQAAEESVVAIGAHPGDVELGAAGALLAHLAAGVPVTILTLSPARPAGAQSAGAGETGGTGAAETGGNGAAGEGIGTRVGVADLLGADPDVRDPAIAAIEKLLEQAKPTVLYTHSFHDSEPEHRDVHTAVVGAARRVGRVFCFQSPSATLDFRPAHFVAIGDYLPGKLKAAGAYLAQDEVRGFLEPDQITSTASYWARYCAGRPAEAFEVVRDVAPAGGTASQGANAAAAP